MYLFILNCSSDDDDEVLKRREEAKLLSSLGKYESLSSDSSDSGKLMCYLISLLYSERGRKKRKKHKHSSRKCV